MAGGVLLLLVGVMIAAGLWFLLLRTPEEASEPIRSVTLNTAVTVTGTDATTDFVIFELVQAESEVRFSLGELLRGEPKIVVGTTDQVAAQLAVNLSRLADTQVGPIQINARTLFTDNNLRNNAIRNRILFTDEFELITFVPTEIAGLPESTAVGEPVSFEITGELTIKDVTNSETFAVTAVARTPSRLEGTAVTAITRSNYQLFVPDVTAATNVDEEVQLEINFVAVPTP